MPLAVFLPMEHIQSEWRLRVVVMWRAEGVTKVGARNSGVGTIAP